MMLHSFDTGEWVDLERALEEDDPFMEQFLPVCPPGWMKPGPARNMYRALRGTGMPKLEAFEQVLRTAVRANEG